MKANPLILAIETATLAGSVCLARGEHLLATRVGSAEQSHSNSLLRDIDGVLSDAHTSLSDVELFAAAIGPGSFTGLRIGLATVKALAVTLNRECIAVPTLNAIAKGVGTTGYVIALLPAGRGEMFSQMFEINGGGFVQEVDQPSHLSPQRVLTRYQELQQIVWAGPAAQMHRELIESFAIERKREWEIAPIVLNLSKPLVAVALQKYRIGATVKPELLQALYVRPSDAELKANVINN